ncbi:MAG: prephenate dehydrogenase, partial [Achromobacter pestifer]
LPHLGAATVLTDAGSTKAEVVEAAREALGGSIGRFVPGHPIAGAERTGPDAADAELYRGRTVIPTPITENSASSADLVRRAWEACGASVIDMDADAHDRVLASVSHLPHLLSSVYMEQVATAADARTRLDLAGSGFRDFTRIAAGSPEMWRDIFLSNRDAMLAELADLRAVLDRAERAIAHGDDAALLALLDTAAQARRRWRKE